MTGPLNLDTNTDEPQEIGRITVIFQTDGFRIDINGGIEPINMFGVAEIIKTEAQMLYMGARAQEAQRQRATGLVAAKTMPKGRPG